ncbi:hypothetical protein [Paenibacillus alba]|uniref:DUF4340 domain-containing protein n=1 Tax=Paenibacillus alba TaxID=1197127 RepID=A0ABU6G8R4_9BACL|nr:hypothetical protein [Paenibacillus alba]MEC0230005.1 hypothetical protein [Paenibacillus alba]
MKRYWMLLVLLVFSLSSISFHYVGAVQGPKPDYYLKMVTGKEEEAAGLAVKGSYQVEPIVVTTKGSEYPNDHQSYLEKMDFSYYYDVELKELLNEHRSFMRGKKDRNAFFEEDNVIGYVGSDYQYDLDKGQSDILDIALYDKGKKKNSAAFKVQIKKNADDYISICDVQIKGQTMKVLIVFQQPLAGKRHVFKNPEYHMYTIDLDKKMVVAHERIETGAKQEDKLKSVVTYTGASDFLKSNRYEIFDQRTYEWKDGNEDNRKLMNRELFVYDIWKGQLTKILNESIHELLMKPKVENQTIQQVGDDLYISLISEAEPSQVMRYDLVENKIKSDTKLELQTMQSKWGQARITQIVNNRVYVLMLGKLNPEVAIIDLDTKKTVYEGVVERRGSPDMNELAISDLSVK